MPVLRPAGWPAGVAGGSDLIPSPTPSSRGFRSWDLGEPPGGATAAVLLPVLLRAAVVLSLTMGVSGPTSGGWCGRIYTRILPWGPVGGGGASGGLLDAAGREDGHRGRGAGSKRAMGGEFVVFLWANE